MDKPRSPTGGYFLAALLGATAGGIAVAIVTRAIPTMMSHMMSNMMMRMGGEGCDPPEMWRRMMGGFGEANSESAQAASLEP